jgi:hypothetical protein
VPPTAHPPERPKGDIVSSAPSASLDSSQTIRDSFTIYQRSFGVIFPAGLLVYGLLFVATLAFPKTAAGGILAMILSVVLSIVYAGAIVQLVRDLQDGALDATVGQLISSVKPVLTQLLLVSLVSGVIIGFGFALLIVPGLIAMTLFAVAAPVTVIERPGAFAALSRSRELVTGHGWQVFGVILWIVALNIVIAIITAITSAPFGTAGGALVQWLVSAAILPVAAIAYTVTYLRLRELHGEAPVSSDVTGAAGTGTPGGVPTT